MQWCVCTYAEAAPSYGLHASRLSFFVLFCLDCKASRIGVMRPSMLYRLPMGAGQLLMWRLLKVMSSVALAYTAIALHLLRRLLVCPDTVSNSEPMRTRQATGSPMLLSQSSGLPPNEAHYLTQWIEWRLLQVILVSGYTKQTPHLSSVVSLYSVRLSTTPNASVHRQRGAIAQLAAIKPVPEPALTGLSLRPFTVSGCQPLQMHPSTGSAERYHSQQLIIQLQSMTSPVFLCNCVQCQIVNHSKCIRPQVARCCALKSSRLPAGPSPGTIR
jgi:hypothetical protein